MTTDKCDHIQIWDTQAGACLSKVYHCMVETLLILALTKELLSCSHEEICIWDIHTGMCVKKLKCFGSGQIWAIPNINRLVVSNTSYKNKAYKTHQIWDLNTSRFLKIIEQVNYLEGDLHLIDGNYLLTQLKENDYSISLLDLKVDYFWNKLSKFSFVGRILGSF